MTAIDIAEGSGQTLVKMDSDSHIIKSFTVSEEQITATGTWRFVQLLVSHNKSGSYPGYLDVCVADLEFS